MAIKAKTLHNRGAAIKYSPMNSIKGGSFNTLSEFGNLERFDKTIMRIHPLRSYACAPGAAPPAVTPEHVTRPHAAIPSPTAVDAVTFDIL